MADYASDLLSQATQAYPFIQRHNPAVIVNENGGEGYAETYPKGETGAPLEGGGFSRPKELPIGRVGVEIYKPDEFNHHSLAGEILHDDPYANEIRDKLSKTWSEQQLPELKHMALDYGTSIKQGQSEDRAIQNATDSAMRGYVVGQWPTENNDRLGYNPEQMQLLNNLQNYMATPPSRKELIQQQIDKIE